ncbi:anthranilate/aminodeoxychorismate synthase component II [Vibrio breoganii]|uniref:aminodeoxychorismate/anthranilate synthase component II n=1 Tax=Vibrio breoganii TaxID=553239 RepID=UPI000C834F72|nr:aminodeoxychorismate/anthranilate synthase component II [Vibrio breoganii]PML06690.1 anthranilate/aminodeoxychorismate synthase component II [Vibrio breoganii]
MLLIIDNYDSFTYNLYQYFCELGCDTKVVRNDAITIVEIHALQPQAIVISPGPCTPNEAGISLQVIQEFMGQLPLLGVCLGHQAIAQVLGGKVIRADKVMHGKTSPIQHTNTGVFSGLNNPLTVTRYHSLIVEKETLPECLEITAWTLDEKGQQKEIMGYRHKTLPVEAVQFHPESIKTEQGHEILANFLARIPQT